jgi:glycosyltransferase involved in cell wall biosynthesis
MRPAPALIVEVHGDWRTAGRLYGSRWRRFVAPLSDRAALLALKRADATRAVSEYTATLIEEATGRPPLAVFPTYTDIQSFLRGRVKQVPEIPTAIWVGVLERYKNAEGLDRIWRRVAVRLPEARLVVIGDGPFRPLVDRLARDMEGQVRVIKALPPSDVARSLDEATLLFLPSRSEGFPRVIIEAFTRGRPVIATAVGGIPDAVVSERNGVLVALDDDDAAVDALVRVLSDHELACRLGSQARADAETLQWMPGDYARAMHELVDSALAVTRDR